jgi:hypothetical protein
MVMTREGYGWPYVGMADEIKVAQTHAMRRTLAAGRLPIIAAIS